MPLVTRRLLRCLVATALIVFNIFGSEQNGAVTFGGLPVPGATVTASQGDKKFTTVTDQQGKYSFPDLADGVWTIQVEMSGFTPAKGEITAASGATTPAWELKMLPLDQIHAETQLAAPPKPVAPPTPATTADTKKPEAAAKAPEPAQEELAQRAEDGILINGSQNNAASSPFALFPAFGNN